MTTRRGRASQPAGALVRMTSILGVASVAVVLSGVNVECEECDGLSWELM